MQIYNIDNTLYRAAIFFGSTTILHDNDILYIRTCSIGIHKSDSLIKLTIYTEGVINIDLNNWAFHALVVPINK